MFAFSSVLELDEAGSLQHLERAAAVGRVVRDSDGIAVLELIDRLHLVGVQVERNDEGIADVLDLVAVAVALHQARQDNGLRMAADQVSRNIQGTPASFPLPHPAAFVSLL